MATTLTQWHPFSDLEELRSRFDRLFDQIGDGEERMWAPSLDLVKEEGRLILKVDLPGIKPEDVQVEVKDGRLTVSGEHTEEHHEHKGEYLRRERRFGSFSRSMSIPEGVDPKEIQATTKDGLLEVIIPVPESKGEATESVIIKPKAE
jgi:HSP20 family protein